MCTVPNSTKRLRDHISGLVTLKEKQALAIISTKENVNKVLVQIKLSSHEFLIAGYDRN